MYAVIIPITFYRIIISMTIFDSHSVDKKIGAKNFFLSRMRKTTLLQGGSLEMLFVCFFTGS
ncbi:MAG: hypothetical protein A3D96_03260 [Chlamydiae bacterium RIFCSPHIGHO2_12_FULL_44_59]|nr:MAG: hypothetical protein A2796_00325 [Chlamydiae bacterium RIFCSPHIGHO2_01_FULL_44_39]OGN56716.1 MAG: hypothetical protein A3C42_06095 [Chlamydiae bacterium RIFCSPHIGHO2_02_FULL_45_9]OGN60588.1 MAG: hypothetical protein A3D96_03260 [Chlamydiae bacterium RIFCSPHIGHO2_12_FULL_44_59]OGN69455.1 MAG: hypothetical protein A3I67_04270 [Chlamydiae bacterium RIFCSPLOWO2_02_FULL_45_22]